MSAIEERTRSAYRHGAAGLSSAEAARRLEADGPNALPVARRVRLWRRVLMQLRDPLVAVLLVAAALTIGTGDWTDAGVILLVIVVNTSVGVAQEVEADQAIAAVGTLTAPHARVVRDGQQRQIAPADADLVEAAALLVDESALTGESVPVDKGAVPEIESDSASDHESDGSGWALSAGTVVVRGRGLAVVTATGTQSAMGRIAADRKSVV